LTTVLQLLENINRPLGKSGGRLLEHEQAGIFLDQRWCLIGDARQSELRIAVLRKGRRRGEIEAGCKHAADPIGLVHRGEALHGLDSLGRLRAVVVFDQLDFSRAALELKSAARVDLMGP